MSFKVMNCNRNKCSFFSRDLRTHQLFRNSWHIAADKSKITQSVILRGFGVIRLLIAVKIFFGSRSTQRIIFGTSEILLYSLLSSESDVWVFTGLGRLLTNRSPRSKIVRWLLSRSYRGQLTVVLNANDRQEIKTITQKNPILIEGEGYRFAAEYDTKCFQEKSCDLHFTYVGRILRSKGVDQILRAYAEKSLKNWTLTVIGDNDYGNSDCLSESEISRLSAASKGAIVFTGFRSNVKSLLQDQDIYISMSVREGLPFSVLDAIDAGLFIILSAVPGHLSFEGLPGVRIVKNGLENVLMEIAHNSEDIFKFDRMKRIEECNKRFGQNTIVDQICETIFKQK